MGFTMSIFVTLLALGAHSPDTDTAKLAVLVASVVASGLGYAAEHAGRAVEGVA
ncbi:Na+/H+ antiporter NhaA [Hymenobacter amundsenii]|uniref:Na+/H+ antiporter NhaA n=1 Tax=Hymenobacter amundsenii TaxID=2006685 RepID=UPI0021CDBB89|nr:Na+/H+ antiporter NhaA [Hymenobacter amundsenii]